MEKISKEFIIKKPIIYFLWYNDEIVYIGESGVGIRRASEHSNTKICDYVSLIDAPADKAEREYQESLLITKHNPKYNKSKGSQKKKMLQDGYLNLELLREIIRKEYSTNSYLITNTLKRDVKKECKTILVSKTLYVDITSLATMIHKKYPKLDKRKNMWLNIQSRIYSNIYC